jgi:HAD superfamily hydrolase (TIGR01509 family)
MSQDNQPASTIAMSNLAQFRAAIFDMDGLLLDTEATSRWAWDQAMAEHGYRMTDEIYQQFIGLVISDRGKILQDRFGAEFPCAAIMARRVELGDTREIEQGLVVKPGAVELVQALAAKGIPLAVATGTFAPRTLRRLKTIGLHQLFKVIVTGDQVTAGKPAPDIFLEASKRLGVAPEHCLVFEDSCAGVEAAANAGMQVIMVPDLEMPTPKIQSQAYRILPSLQDAFDIGIV